MVCPPARPRLLPVRRGSLPSQPDLGWVLKRAPACYSSCPRTRRCFADKAGGLDKRGNPFVRAGVCVDVFVQGSVCAVLLPTGKCNSLRACVCGEEPDVLFLKF